MSAISGASIDQLSSTIRLDRPDDLNGWRCASRAYLAAGVPPDAIAWKVGHESADLFESTLSVSAYLKNSAINSDSNIRVPPDFLELAERVVCHCSPERFGLLYRVLWRRAHSEVDLLSCLADPDIHRLHALGKSVSRERHKMHAFVRFKQTLSVEHEHFVAWFEPEHYILRLSADFFVRRFANMHWSIVTPEESANWDGETLSYGPGGSRGTDSPDGLVETLWSTYFTNIFNPARLKLNAMRAEMPIKYWKNLPEASLIADLASSATARTEQMLERAPSKPSTYSIHATAPRVSDKVGDPTSDPKADS